MPDSAPAPEAQPAPPTTPPITGTAPNGPPVDANALFATNTANSAFASVPDSNTPAVAKAPADRANVVAMAIGNTDKTGADQYTDFVAKHAAAFDKVTTAGDEMYRAAAQNLDDARTLSFYASQGLAAQQAGDLKTSASFSALAQGVISENQALTQKSALEKMAVGQMLEAQKNGDPYQAWVIQRNLADGAENTLVENNATLLALHRAVQESSVTEENQNWFERLGTVLLSLIPSNPLNTVDVANHIQAGTASWLNALNTGSTVAATTNNIWNMPYKQRIEFINTQLVPMLQDHSGLLGLHNKTEALDGLSEIAQNGNMMHYLDASAMNAMNLLPVFGDGKLLASPVRMALRLGGPKMSVSVAAQLAAEIKGLGPEAALRNLGGTTEDVIDAVTPTAMDPSKAGIPITTETSGNVLAHGASQATNIAVPLIEQSIRAGTTTALSTGELADSARTWEGVMRSSKLGSHVQDVQVVPRQMGVSTVQIAQTTLGRSGSASGFMTEQAAKNAATRLHLDATTIQGPDGGWRLLHEQVIPDDVGQHIPPVPAPGNWFNQMLNGVGTVVGRPLGGTRVISDLGIANQGASASDTMSSLQNFFKNRYSKAFSSLDGRQADQLSHALAGMSNQTFWMSDRGLEEFYQRSWGKAVTDKEMAAYHAYIEHNDVKYHLENTLMYKQKAQQGLEGLTLKTGAGANLEQVNARVDRSLGLTLEDLNSEPVWHDGALRNGTFKDTDLADLKKRNYAISTMEEPAELSGGDRFRRVLTKPGDPDNYIHGLNPTQVPYIGGGNRMYADGLYYLKQASKNALGIMENPNVLSAGTKAQVDYMAQLLNGARDIYKGHTEDMNGALKGIRSSGKRSSIMDNAAVNRRAALDDHFNGDVRWDGASYEQHVADGRINQDHDWGTHYDKEMPAEYNASEVKSWAATGETGSDQMRRSTGRLFFGSKGSQLLDWQGKLVPTLAPMEMLDRTTRAVSHMVSMDDFKQSSMQRWFNTYKGILDYDAKMSPMQIFNKAKPLDNTPIAMRSKMEAQRDVIKRILGYQSPDMEAMNSYQRGIRDYVQGNDPFNSRRQASVDWWNAGKNPVQSLKNFAFDTRIGLFDISRFPLHASISASAMALDPVHGLQGFLLWPVVRHFLQTAPEQEEGILNTLIGRGVHTMGGLKADEFKAYMTFLKDQGFLHTGGSSELRSANATNLINHYTVMKHSTVFFDEAEFLNRTTAARIAWEDAKNAGPRGGRFGLVQKSSANAWTKGMEASPEFRQMFAGRARDYSGNMDTASSAAWQRGLLGIPTQFYAYAVRQFEAMVGTRFTTAQKARLLLSHTLLYGSAGTIGGSVVSNVYSSLTGLKPGEEPASPTTNPLDTALGAMDRGLIDESIYHTIGADVSMGERYGTGNFLPELFREAFGFSSFGEKSLADIGGGASFGQAKSLIGTLYDITRYAAAESGDRSMPLTGMALERLMANAAGFSHGLKALMIFNYGRLQSNQGSIMAVDVPKVDAFAMALLGVQPGEASQMSAMKAYMDNKDNAVKELRNQMLGARERLTTQPDSQEDIMSEMNTLSRLNDPYVVAQASKQATHMMPHSILQSFQLRYERMKAEEDAAQTARDNDPQQQDNQP